MAETKPPSANATSEQAAADMLADLATGEIESVLIGLPDTNGVFRGKRVPVDHFATTARAKTHISDLLFGLDIADGFLDPPARYEGYWPSWELGWDDFTAIADPTTYRRVPWLDRTAMVLLDLYTPAGDAVELAPRNILQRVVARLPEGNVAYMAPEFEFTMLKGDNESIAATNFADLTPLSSSPSCYGVARANADEHIIKPIRDALSGIGLHIEACGAEAGFGQYELNLPPAHAVRAADEAFLFKHTVREIANLHGHTATFMAKPIGDGFGSSQHVHLSMWSADGVNLFHDPDDEIRLSKLARHYIAGVMATLREFTAIYAPTVNSYRRLTPHSAAGTTCTWAVQARSVSVRVINDSPAGTRVELRTPGADANPHLVFAALLAGGLWGIENELDPGAPYAGNAYLDDSLETVPTSLQEAAELFASSEIAKRYFGEEAVRYFAATRRIEAAQFAAAVTDWEVKRYLCRV